MRIGVFASMIDQEEVVTLNSAIWRARKDESGKVYTLYQIDSFFIEFCYSGNGTVVMNYYASLEDLNTRLLASQFDASQPPSH